MIRVCAIHNGGFYELAEFDRQEDAEDFMKCDFVLNYADEFDESAEDDVIHSDEMFIDEEIPFCEPCEEADDDKLPF